jgi:hypothetical protein
VIEEILKAQRPVGEIDEVAMLGTHGDGPTATEDKSRGPIPVEGDDLVTTSRAVDGGVGFACERNL